MDPAERLADYLAGELAPDEHAAVEAELARDPALRAQLSALQAADGALAQLSSPSPPAGFEERLDAILDQELTAQLGRGVADVPETTVPSRPNATEPGGDELSQRRARRAAGMPRWVTAVSGAAAAVVVLAGGGLVVSNMLTGEDGEAGITTMQADGARESDDSAPAMDAMGEAADEAASADGPLLANRDRTFEDADVEALLLEPEAFALAETGLAVAEAGQISNLYRGVFETALRSGVPGQTLDEQADSGDSDDAADMPQTEQSFGAELRREGDIGSDDEAAVARCLEVLLADDLTAVPVYAELATYDDVEVIVFGLVTEQPGTGTFARREAWVLERETCAVRLLAQG